MPKEGSHWTPDHKANFIKAMAERRAKKEQEEKEFKGTPEQRERWRKNSQDRRDAKKGKKVQEFPITAISDGREDRVSKPHQPKKVNGTPYNQEEKRLYIAAKLLDTIDFILKGK